MNHLLIRIITIRNRLAAAVPGRWEQNTYKHADLEFLATVAERQRQTLDKIAEGTDCYGEYGKRSMKAARDCNEECERFARGET